MSIEEHKKRAAELLQKKGREKRYGLQLLLLYGSDTAGAEV